MSDGLRSFTGGCHCGALGATLRTAHPVEQWSVRACQCRFCRSHAAVTTSDPSGRLVFHVREPEVLQRYRFALKTADFLLCRRCGVYLGAQVRTGQGAFGIINTRVLTPLPQVPVAVAADYDAESTGERVARRATRWTPLEAIV
jgi:hypothetical protein